MHRTRTVSGLYLLRTFFGQRYFYTKKVRSGYGAGTALIRHRCFRRYLKPGVSVPYTSLQPGDVFIKGGSPGHAVIVVDVAIYTQTGKKVFLLAQSYMPAQQIHILVNPATVDYRLGMSCLTMMKVSSTLRNGCLRRRI